MVIAWGCGLAGSQAPHVILEFPCSKCWFAPRAHRVRDFRLVPEPGGKCHVLSCIPTNPVRSANTARVRDYLAGIGIDYERWNLPAPASMLPQIKY